MSNTTKYHWHTVCLSICDDKYRSNWPEFITDEEVRALADSYASKGMLDTFYREYRNIPVARESASFKAEYFQNYEESEDFLNASPIFESVVLVDPAKTVQFNSDFSAVVGVSVNVADSLVYVRDVVAERLYPDELYEQIFSMADRLNTSVVGIEVTSLNEFITYPLKTLAMRRGKILEAVELHARKSKLERIGALVPFYRQGLVKHNKFACGGLESQLLQFPRSRRLDIADALAYIVPMLEEGKRYFQPTQDSLKGEFESLTYDPPLPHNWMAI